MIFLQKFGNIPPCGAFCNFQLSKVSSPCPGQGGRCHDSQSIIRYRHTAHLVAGLAQGEARFLQPRHRDRSDRGSLFLPRLEGSRRHYLQVTNAHFAVAVAETAVQQMTTSEGTAPLITAPFVEYSNDSATCRESFALSVAEAGVEPARELPPTGF